MATVRWDECSNRIRGSTGGRQLAGITHVHFDRRNGRRVGVGGHRCPGLPAAIWIEGGYYGVAKVALSEYALPPDADGDGVPDASDNCLAVANADQLDSDGDDLGDVCDSYTQRCTITQDRSTFYGQPTVPLEIVNDRDVPSMCIG